MESFAILIADKALPVYIAQEIDDVVIVHWRQSALEVLVIIVAPGHLHLCTDRFVHGEIWFDGTAQTVALGIEYHLRLVYEEIIRSREQFILPWFATIELVFELQFLWGEKREHHCRQEKEDQRFVLNFHLHLHCEKVKL